MELVLLKKDFDENNIKIETEEIFQHLKDFLFEDSKEYISSKLCSIYALEIDNYIR
jgi:flagellin-specific chaperone FliS